MLYQWVGAHPMSGGCSAGQWVGGPTYVWGLHSAGNALPMGGDQLMSGGCTVQAMLYLADMSGGCTVQAMLYQWVEGPTYVWGLHSAGNALWEGGPTYVWGCTVQAMLYQWVGGPTYVGQLHSAGNALPMGGGPNLSGVLHSAGNALPMGGWPTYVWGLHSAGNALPMGRGPNLCQGAAQCRQCFTNGWGAPDLCLEAAQCRQCFTNVWVADLCLGAAQCRQCFTNGWVANLCLGAAQSTQCFDNGWVADLCLGAAQRRQCFTNGWRADLCLTYVLGLHNAGNALQMGGVVLGGGVTYVWGLHSAAMLYQWVGGRPMSGAAQCSQCFTNGWVADLCLGLHSAGNTLPMDVGGPDLCLGGAPQCRQCFTNEWVTDLCLGAAQCRQCFTNGWWPTYICLHRGCSGGQCSADNALPMGRWPTYVWRLHSAVNALPVGGGGWVGGRPMSGGCIMQAMHYKWVGVVGGGATYV